MSVHSQLNWRLRRVPYLALPSALRLPVPSENAFAPKYAQAAIALLVELAAIITSLLLVVRLFTPAATPFTAYESVFPGAPKQAVIEHGFTCQPGYNAARTEFCSFHPSAGMFSHIGVWVADDVIHRITFTFQEGAFRLGDLAWAWDRDAAVHTRQGNHRLSFELADSPLHVAARTESGTLNPFLSLQWVTLVAKNS
jgi:hypothetical protein